MSNSGGRTTFTFSVPAQSLANALIMLSKQSRTPIIFHSEITDSKMAPALHKTVTLEQALNELLADSDLNFAIIDQRFIVISDKLPDHPKNTLTLEQLFPPGLEQLHIYGHKLTGSRLTRAHTDGSTPIEILTKPELNLRGSATVAEKLKFLPAVSGNPTSTAVTNGGDGTATVTLRGLPASNTLVLINGRRVAADGLEGDAIDLNTISPAAIDRIEILKDGASAIYGADAIAGVVNIVMKEHYNGLFLETFYGQTSRNDMQTNNTNLLWGRDFKYGSIFVSLTSYEQEGILSRDRTESANADGRRWGGVDERSSATPAARITLSPGNTVILGQDANGQYLNPNDTDSFRTATTEDLYNYSQQTAAFVPHEHKSIYANVQLDLSERIGLFLETSVDSTSARTRFAPTPLFTAFESTPVIVSANNRYNPFGVDIADVRRRMVEMPARVQENDSTVKRIVTGLKGIHEQWSWDISYAFSQSKANEKSTNLLNINKLKTALGPDSECTDDCVSLNVFGPPGSISNDQLRFISTENRTRGLSRLNAWSFNIVGPLATINTGQVELATGVEYRTETTSKKPLRNNDEDLTIGGANFGQAKGTRTVIDAYVETSLPLLHKQSSEKSLDLELSTRYSNYNDFGETTNPKVGLVFRPNPDLLLRSTWSRGFRAPSLNEMYKVASEKHARLTDPCSIADNVDLLPGCTQQTDSNRTQYLTEFEGNQDLQPERSTNNTLGLIWTPRKLPRFTSSIDIFRIKQRDVVDANAQNIVNMVAQTNAYSELVIRNIDGEIQKVIAKNLNVGKREVKGLDINVRYQLPSQTSGRYALAINASHIHSYTTQANKHTVTKDIAGTFADDATDGLGAIPKWKANAGLIWKLKNWQGTYTIHYISSLEETVPGTQSQRDIYSWITHDAQLGYTFDFAGELQILAGIDNLFDNGPPRVASGFNDNLDSRTHELKGRFYYLKFSQQF